VRLAHSSSWLVDTEPAPKLYAASPDAEGREHVRVGRSWFASAKRSLLATFGVGTIDQALLGIVAAKHFFIRQFGLAGKVVILDELHTYDLYTSTLIDELVRRLRELQCTIIILSATLTKRRRRQLLGLADAEPVSEAYPLISGIAPSQIERTCAPPPSKTIQIRKVSRSLPVQEAIDRASHGECLLWIRNTVDEAQETYRTLKSSSVEGGPGIALLYSRFPFFRREQLENEWMDKLGTLDDHGSIVIRVCKRTSDPSVGRISDRDIAQMTFRQRPPRTRGRAILEPWKKPVGNLEQIEKEFKEHDCEQFAEGARTVEN
jgi:CRISPR-associated endonuclease/helicase Cas3